MTTKTNITPATTGFTKKLLTLTIALGTGELGETVGETVTLSGLRMSADMVNSIGDGMGTLQLRVFGLKEDVMNRLTSVGVINTAFKLANTVRLDAGDEENGMQWIFQGMVYDAWADYDSAPDVSFNILAHAGMQALLKPVSAISFKGSADVAEIMAGLAKTMGLAFEDNGVKVKLSNPYFSGTALMQVRSCAQAADIWHKVELNTLVIWPKDAARAGAVPLISPATGMVGYPSLSSKRMAVRMMFNSAVRLGGDVQVESSMTRASGKFNVYDISHSLSSETPGGPWFTTVTCSPLSV
jgi:hypothetical protein